MELIARFKPGENVPASADPASVLAGRFVRVAATKDARGAYRMQHCGAGARANGVAERDAIGGEKNWRGDFNVVRRGSIARVTAGAALVAGQDVTSDATGRAVPVAGAGAGAIANGMAMHDVAAAGDVAEVDLF